MSVSILSNTVVPVNTKYHLSSENRKLVPSEESNFFIWNLPAVKTCPNRTALCEKYCYARKAEKCYPEVLPARTDNFQMSKLPTFENDMTEFILDRAKKMRKHVLIVRIHESGDFYNQEYTNKWLRIIANVQENCPKNKTVIFIAYTKSFRYFDGHSDENF